MQVLITGSSGPVGLEAVTYYNAAGYIQHRCIPDSRLGDETCYVPDLGKLKPHCTEWSIIAAEMVRAEESRQTVPAAG